MTHEAFRFFDVGPVDLRQRGISRIVPVAADREPFCAGRLTQVGFRQREPRSEHKKKCCGPKAFCNHEVPRKIGAR